MPRVLPDNEWRMTAGGRRWFIARRWRGFENGTVCRVWVEKFGNLAIHVRNAGPGSVTERRALEDVIDATSPYPPGVSYR